MQKKYRKTALHPGMCALISLLSFVSIIFSCERLDIKRITKVSTGSVSGITAFSSIIQGNIVELGEAGIKQHGHCWSVTNNPTISGAKTELGTRSSAGTFNSTLIELSPDTKYFVRAYATDDEGTSYGDEINFTTSAIPVPASPGNLEAWAISTSQITLVWTDNSDNEDGFKIEILPGGGTNWSEIDTAGPDVTTYQSTGLSPSTSYSYRIRAYNAGGSSDYSNVTGATTPSDVPLPPAPSNLTAEAVSSSQIDLGWADNSDSEEGFIIERSPDGSSGWVEIDTAGAGITTFQDIGLSPSTQFYYRVKAYNAAGNSDYSNTANAITLSEITVPSAPTNLSADANTSSQIDLGWADNSDNEEGFKIERSPDGSSGWVEIATVGAGITTFQNLGLSPSTQYCYRVRAYNAGGNSEPSNTACNTTQPDVPVPFEPTNLSADANTSSQIDLGWADNSDNEEGFKIERSPDGSTNWAEIATVGAGITTFRNMGLSPSTQYCYRVRAYNAGGNSGPSNTACNTTLSDILIPAAPANLTAEAISDSRIDLSWADNSDNEEGFKIERSPDGSTNWVEIVTVGAGITTFQNRDLTPSTPYYYRVRAYNTGGNSDYSNTAYATTLPEVSIPTAPTVLVATPITSSQITLRWTDNSVNEVGFIIERSPDGSTGWNEIGTVGNNTTIYDDMGLSPSTLYYYRVRAYNAGGNSDYSNMDDAATLSDIPVPAAPTNLVAEAISDSRIDLSWTDNADNEDGFRIERSPDGSNWEEIATVGADITTFQNIDLTHSTLYYYRVRAYNTGGNSDYSNIAYAETPLCPGSLIIDHIAGDVAPVTETNFRYGVVETSLSGENKCWIKQNLGAHHVAGGPTDDTEESAGWYWQFNRKQGYQHDGSTRTPGTTWIYPIDEASDWTANNDPCTILFGRGWRIPTQMEWTNTENNGVWNNYNDTYASDLKLHGAGELVFHDGSLYYRGLGGAYWSSTQYDGAKSWWLTFDAYISMMEVSYKTLGLSVRCIRD